MERPLLQRRATRDAPAARRPARAVRACQGGARLELRENAIEDGPVSDERNDPHRAPAPDARERVHLENAPEQIGPSATGLAGGDRSRCHDDGG